MNGNDKLRELRDQNSLVNGVYEEYDAETKKKIADRLQQADDFVKQQKANEIAELEKSVEERALEYVDDEINGLATLIWDNRDIRYDSLNDLLMIIKNKFPEIYVEILEAYILGEHDS